MNEGRQTGPLNGQHPTPWRSSWLRFKGHGPGWISFWFLVAFTVFIGFEPLLFRTDPHWVTHHAFNPPNKDHWFGTDMHGRDLLARVMAGSRVSLMIGAAGAFVSLVVGVAWGAVSGYFGGRWDNIMMRIVDIIYSLPSLIFVIVLITSLEALFKRWLEAGFGPSVANHARMVFLLIGLGSVSWLTMARIVRGQVLSLKTRPFVEASRVLGGGSFWILKRHILPNLFGIIVVYLMLTIPSIILYESFLSYLGLGIQPPNASLGSLIAEGASQINSVRVYWWMILFPGGLLAALLMGLNFLGDALKDALDPKIDS